MKDRKQMSTIVTYFKRENALNLLNKNFNITQEGSNDIKVMAEVWFPTEFEADGVNVQLSGDGKIDDFIDGICKYGAYSADGLEDLDLLCMYDDVYEVTDPLFKSVVSELYSKGKAPSKDGELYFMSLLTAYAKKHKTEKELKNAIKSPGFMKSVGYAADIIEDLRIE